MKSITYAEKSWLLGDEAADVVVEYAVLLARTNSADSISLSVFTEAWDERILTMLIGPATMMTSSTVDTLRSDPDNAEAVALIRERMRVIQSPPIALPARDRAHDVAWEDLG